MPYLIKAEGINEKPGGTCGWVPVAGATGLDIECEQQVVRAHFQTGRQGTLSSVPNKSNYTSGFNR